MKMSGWVVEDDHVRLRDDSCVQIVSHLLVLKEAELNKNMMQPSQCSPKIPLTILGERELILMTPIQIILLSQTKHVLAFV